MSRKSTVTERGQTAIPARIRRESGVEAGAELLWEIVGPDEWKVTILRRPAHVPDPRAMRGFARRFRTPRRTADWMRELRAGEP
jgi:bifunctional DNA-binding transcriptional regulator/antitoxin component of YhaV-PrlF toxin-antitoxin module